MLTSGSTGSHARGPGYAAILFLAMLVAAQVASATPVMLEAWVVSPAPPIHQTDVIELRARTPDIVFRDPFFTIDSRLSYLGNFAIDWRITSYAGPGGGTPEPRRLYAFEEIVSFVPLPVGTYHVTVEWQDAGGPLIDPAVNSGTGAFSFEVVPEPGSLALLATGSALLVCFRRRAQRSNRRRTGLLRESPGFWRETDRAI